TFAIAAITAIATIAISRYVSLGSVLSAVAAIVCGLVFYFVGLAHPHFFALVNLPTMLYLVIGPGLLILFHHDNIGRLLSGTERKIGQKVKVEENSTPTTLKA